VPAARERTRRRGQARVCLSRRPGAATGLSATCEETGGAGLIVIYNSGRYRMAGRGSLAGLLAYGNANDIVVEMAREVLPVVRRNATTCHGFYGASSRSGCPPSKQSPSAPRPSSRSRSEPPGRGRRCAHLGAGAPRRGSRVARRPIDLTSRPRRRRDRGAGISRGGRRRATLCDSGHRSTAITQAPGAEVHALQLIFSQRPAQDFS
jgi:hypothetical protein